MGESIFRSGKEGVDDLVTALHKMANNQKELAELEKTRQEMIEKTGKTELSQLDRYH
jgi:hypothetical protein